VNNPTHIPVLYQEVLDTFQPQPGQNYIDATLGGGGHAQALLQATAPDGRLLGLDADAAAIQRVSQRLAPWSERITLVHSNFKALEEVAQAHQFPAADGILLDLGVSSYQLDEGATGFSFMHAGPLDMRFDHTQGSDAASFVNHADEKELADVIYTYGEERYARRIARAIVRARPLHNTQELAELVARTVRPRPHRRIHPATRTFQALRIYINDELAALQTVLPQAVRLLRPGGILAVISFHSLEDRIVKQFMRQESQDCICPPRIPICQCHHRASIVELYRKGLTAQAAETDQNPRSRSARLRAARKLDIPSASFAPVSPSSSPRRRSS